MFVQKFVGLFLLFLKIIHIEGDIKPNIIGIKIALRKDPTSHLEPVEFHVLKRRQNEDKNAFINNQMKLSSEVIEIVADSNEITISNVEKYDIKTARDANERKKKDNKIVIKHNVESIPYYKVFFEEIFKMVIEIDKQNLVKLIKAFGDEVEILHINHDFIRLGEPFSTVFKKMASVVKTVPIEILKGAAATGIKALSGRQQVNSEINTIIDNLNNLVTTEEGYKILNVIDKIKNYPKSNKLPNRIVKDMFNILLHQFRKDDEATNVVINSINKIVMKFLLNKITKKDNPIEDARRNQMENNDKLKNYMIAYKQKQINKENNANVPQFRSSIKKHKRKSKNSKKLRKHKKHKKSRSKFGINRYLHRFKKYFTMFKGRSKRKQKKSKHTKLRHKKEKTSEESLASEEENKNHISIDYNSNQIVDKDASEYKEPMTPQVTIKEVSLQYNEDVANLPAQDGDPMVLRGLFKSDGEKAGKPAIIRKNLINLLANKFTTEKSETSFEAQKEKEDILKKITGVSSETDEDD